MSKISLAITLPILIASKPRIDHRTLLALKLGRGELKHGRVVHSATMSLPTEFVIFLPSLVAIGLVLVDGKL